MYTQTENLGCPQHLCSCAGSSIIFLFPAICMDEKLNWQKLSMRIFQKTNKFAVLPLDTKTGMHGWMDGWMHHWKGKNNMPEGGFHHRIPPAAPSSCDATYSVAAPATNQFH
jgi:hypothetical protein